MKLTGTTSEFGPIKLKQTKAKNGFIEYISEI